MDIPALGGRLELGYLWNHIGTTPDVMNHVLFTNVVVAL